MLLNFQKFCSTFSQIHLDLRPSLWLQGLWPPRLAASKFQWDQNAIFLDKFEVDQCSCYYWSLMLLLCKGKHQRMVLDRWTPKTRSNHRSSSKRLVRKWRHWTSPTRQPWIAARWRQRKLPRYPQQLLQRRCSLGNLNRRKIKVFSYIFFHSIFPWLIELFSTMLVSKRDAANFLLSINI